MYHVSAQGVDERMINVHYYYYRGVPTSLRVFERFVCMGATAALADYRLKLRVLCICDVCVCVCVCVCVRE